MKDENPLFPEVKAEEVPVEKAETDTPTKEEAEAMLAIVDAIMFEGSYSEVISFGRKYKVTLRSRTAGEDNTISQKLDGMTFNTMLSYQNHSALLTLSYSMIDLNGTDYRGVEAKDRYDMVAALPSPLVIILSELMGKFDQKVFQAMEYGKANF